MPATSLMEEILKPRTAFTNTIPYNEMVFSDLLHILNSLNRETDPINAPSYRIQKGRLKCVFQGETQEICCIDAIESYVITPIGIRIFDRDASKEYILALNRE